jgi:oligopeptide transport system permease protein
MATAADAELLTRVGEVQGRSLWQDARRRLFRNKAAVVSMVLLGLIMLGAIFAPWLSPHPFDEIYWDRIGMPPDYANAHWFGTDNNGRDLFVRVLYGARVSLAVGVSATLVSLIIGVVYGAVSGFLGGKTDEVMMRIVDILYSLPFMFFVIILMVVFGRNIVLLFIALGAVEWLTMARIVRGQTIALRHKEFVEAARASGATPLQIVFRHIVPNVLGPVVIFATLNVPVIILAESFLSFIGLGVQEPLASLGSLISGGAQQMLVAPWLLVAPALLMLIALLALNFLGDGLRDALDPKER